MPLPQRYEDAKNNIVMLSEDEPKFTKDEFFEGAYELGFTHEGDEKLLSEMYKVIGLLGIRIDLKDYKDQEPENNRSRMFMNVCQGISSNISEVSKDGTGLEEIDYIYRTYNDEADTYNKDFVAFGTFELSDRNQAKLNKLREDKKLLGAPAPVMGAPAVNQGNELPANEENVIPEVNEEKVIPEEDKKEEGPKEPEIEGISKEQFMTECRHMGWGNIGDDEVLSAVYKIAAEYGDKAMVTDAYERPVTGTVQHYDAMTNFMRAINSHNEKGAAEKFASEIKTIQGKRAEYGKSLNKDDYDMAADLKVKKPQVSEDKVTTASKSSKTNTVVKTNVSGIMEKLNNENGTAIKESQPKTTAKAKNKSENSLADLNKTDVKTLNALSLLTERSDLANGFLSNSPYYERFKHALYAARELVYEINNAKKGSKTISLGKLGGNAYDHVSKYLGNGEGQVPVIMDGKSGKLTVEDFQKVYNKVWDDVCTLARDYQDYNHRTYYLGKKETGKKKMSSASRRKLELTETVLNLDVAKKKYAEKNTGKVM